MQRGPRDGPDIEIKLIPDWSLMLFNEGGEAAQIGSQVCLHILEIIRIDIIIRH
jgi:hypothetical protein